MLKGVRINAAIEYDHKRWLAGDQGLYENISDTDLYDFELSSIYPRRINDLKKFRNYLVLATHGEGIVIVNKSGRKLQIKGQDLGSNFVSSVYSENDSIVWVCTSMGLTRIYFDKDINTFKSTTIDDRHGLFWCRS